MALMATRNPSPSSPIRFSTGTRTSSKSMRPVLPARIPSLPWSVPVVRPGIPRSTMKAVIPLWRFARSTDANTRKWSARSAREIQILWPLRTYESPSRRAVVCRAPASVPTPGSVRPKVASFSPFACGTSQRCRCSSVPHCRSVRLLRPTWTLWITRNAVSARSSSSHSSAKLM